MDKLNTIKIFLYENKKKLMVTIALIMVMLTMTLLFLNKTTYKTESLVYENLVQKSDDNIQNMEEKEYYYVDIKGAVYVPGVYSLEKGKRVVDAINEAGGVLPNGDTSLLNLSMELEDGMVIVVYTSDEVNSQETTSQKESTNTVCNGKLVNNACITTSTNQATSKSQTTSDVKETNSKININTASLTELESLPKIGVAKAKAIIDYRTKNGSFKKIEDIKNVSGIGDATFETLKDNITV